MDNIINEAKECLSCKNKPCIKGCPLENDTLSFIKLVKENRIKEAFELLCKTTILPDICGRICPHEKYCQSKCVKKALNKEVKIGEIEAYIGDIANEKGYEIPIISNRLKGKKVCVIGAGPSGLTCAAFLRLNGADVTIYEKYNFLGGLLRYGIPDFRLDNKVLEYMDKKIAKLGIKVEYGKILGSNFSLEEIEKNFDAIYIGIGANISLFMDIEGKNLDGVLGGNELLENNCHPDYSKKSVIVIGGGDVSIDVARTIIRKGAKKVVIAYRRSKEEMPAEKKDVEIAKNEGIEFLFQTNVVKIHGNNKVENVECVKTKLVKVDNDKRLYPVDIQNSNYLIQADYVVMAIGACSDKNVLGSLGLELDKKGNIKVNENYETSRKKVFAGGNVAGFTDTVAGASVSGREAANKIMDYLLK